MPENSSGASIYAKHPTIPYLFLGITDSTSTLGIDPITFCFFRGNGGAAPSTDTNTYHHGCIAQVIDAAGGVLSVYINTGTYASPTWTILNGGSGTYDQSVSVKTNGTTLVPLFGNPSTINASLTGIQVISGSTTSVNVTLSSSGTTLGVFATSTTLGAVTGSGNFTTTPFTTAGSVNIVNSSADLSATATVIATFTTS